MSDVEEPPTRVPSTDAATADLDGPDGERPAGDQATRGDQSAADDDLVTLGWWQHPVNLLVMLAAAAIIAGAVGWSIGRGDRIPAHNDVDTGFLQDMRFHHDQAVAMSLAYLDNPDIAPGLRTVALTIVVGQSIDNGRMVQMLRQINEGETTPTDTAMAWMDTPVPIEEMPGMASREDLDRLAAAEGRDADELFVELMTAHHLGGIHMAEYEAEHGEWSVARDFAQVAVEGQRSDIAEMEQLLG